jgi:sec-independent protein translocase protein TatB
MFDFAWTEIALIVVVALVAIGPKDLPVAIRTVSQLIKKARRMAGEFQTHVDDLVREANLDEVRSQINEIRNFDFKGEVERAVDPDGSLRSTFANNPLDPASYAAGSPAAATEPSEAAVGEHAATVIEAPPDADAVADAAAPADAPAEAVPVAPAFIPPALVPKPEPQAAASAEVPAFIPPAFAKRPTP